MRTYVKVMENEPFLKLRFPYMAALGEHESCITLKSKRCWSAKSQLLTCREQGLGVWQITRAWRTKGKGKSCKRTKIRFDVLKRYKLKYKELNGVNWYNLKNRIDAQAFIASKLLLDNWKGLYMIKDDNERLAMTDAAYNGGLGGVKKDRKLCGLRKNCNPNKWWGHVEKSCSKSKKPLYGNRSACDINRHHVYDVLKIRSNKYYKYYEIKPIE
jgi:hypothetical protein